MISQSQDVISSGQDVASSGKDVASGQNKELSQEQELNDFCLKIGRYIWPIPA